MCDPKNTVIAHLHLPVSCLYREFSQGESKIKYNDELEYVVYLW